MPVQELGEGRLLIDLDFNETPGIIGSYLIPGEAGWSVIETGPASCHDTFMRGLAEAGIAPVEVRNVFLTHIHLDHAGGVGRLAESLPKATFHAHQAGVPHLVDPAKLIASATRVWGDSGMALWGAILPLPVSRVAALSGGERFPVDRGHLTTIATPGHANHHLAYYDSVLNAVLTGDGAGVLLQGSTHIRPAMPPPELDVDLLIQSLERMRAWAPTKLLFSHFGPSEKGVERLTEAAENAQWWVGVAEAAYRKDPTIASLATALEEADTERSRQDGEQPQAFRRAQVISNYEMAAMGLLRYLSKRQAPSRADGQDKGVPKPGSPPASG